MVEKEKPDRERSNKENRVENKGPRKEAINNFLEKDIVISFRGGTKLKGRLESSTQYELIVTISNKPVIVMKHAIDYIELVN